MTGAADTPLRNARARGSPRELPLFPLPPARSLLRGLPHPPGARGPPAAPGQGPSSGPPARTPQNQPRPPQRLIPGGKGGSRLPGRGRGTAHRRLPLVRSVRVALVRQPRYRSAQGPAAPGTVRRSDLVASRCSSSWRPMYSVYAGGIARPISFSLIQSMPMARLRSALT